MYHHISECYHLSSQATTVLPYLGDLTKIGVHVATHAGVDTGIPICCTQELGTRDQYYEKVQ